MSSKKNKDVAKAKAIIATYERSAHDLKEKGLKSIRDIVVESFTEEVDKSNVVFPDGPEPQYLWSFDDVELVNEREVDEPLLHQIHKQLDIQELEVSLDCEAAELKYIELLAASTPTNDEINKKIEECVALVKELNLAYEKTMTEINESLSALINDQIEQHHKDYSLE